MWKWILQLPPVSVTEYFTSRVSQQLDSIQETLIIYPPQHQKIRTEPGNQKKSSRCSIFGNNGKIDSLSDSNDFGEEVIYSHESPKMEEFIRDFDWDLNRFVEYISPFTRKKTLPIKKPV